MINMKMINMETADMENDQHEDDLHRDDLHGDNQWRWPTWRWLTWKWLMKMINIDIIKNTKHCTRKCTGSFSGDAFPKNKKSNNKQQHLAPNSKGNLNLLHLMTRPIFRILSKKNWELKTEGPRIDFRIGVEIIFSTYKDDVKTTNIRKECFAPHGDHQHGDNQQEDY